MNRKWRWALGLVFFVLAAVLLYWGLRPPEYEVLVQPLPVVVP